MLWVILGPYLGHPYLPTKPLLGVSGVWGKSRALAGGWVWGRETRLWVAGGVWVILFPFWKDSEKVFMARFRGSYTLLDINRLKVWKH